MYFFYYYWFCLSSYATIYNTNSISINCNFYYSASNMYFKMQMYKTDKIRNKKRHKHFLLLKKIE